MRLSNEKNKRRETKNNKYQKRIQEDKTMKNTMTKVSKITGMAAALAAISMVFTGCASIEGTATITPEGASTGTVVNYSADVAG